MEKSLDRKLASIHADPSGSKEFILCDAKDQDMAFGLAATGNYASHETDRTFAYRSREEFLDQIRGVIRQGLVDIVLMSNSTSERLTLEERLFEKSHVTPAVRANDTTDIFVVRGGVYPTVPSRPFRSATIPQLMCGKVQCTEKDLGIGPNLGLYSMTFNNDLERDTASLEAYKTFRLEAEVHGFRHFLEIFNPNISGAVDPKHLGHFINDHIVRTLAAVPKRSRPIFLKTVFQGPRHMEELVHFDPHLVVGVLGGAAGTTFDAFDLLFQARKYGARAALFGRKINNAEHQPAFIKFLRMIADVEIEPTEAVRAYHGVLEQLGIKPRRALKEDLMATADLFAGDETSSASVVVPERGNAWSYGASAPEASSRTSTPSGVKVDNVVPFGTGSQRPAEEEPDFSAMTLEQKLAYQQKRRDQIFG